MRRVCAQLALAVACASLAWGQAAEPPTRPVGVRGVVRGVVGPAELRPRHPASGRPPLVVRVLGAAPHGSAFRYDLEFYGLEAGRYDLADYLELADGSRPTGLGPLPVLVRDPLLGFEAPQPEALTPGALPQRGGYRAALLVGGAVWALGLLALVAFGLRRKRASAQTTRAGDAVDPLAALSGAARERALTPTEQGLLERLLLARWLLAAGLSELPPERALSELRDDPRYGPKLACLEAWLHRPQPEPADLDALLAEREA